MKEQKASQHKPIVLITGAAGNIGESLCEALQSQYRVIGLDIQPSKQTGDSFECDLSSDESVKLALHKVRENYGTHIAAVIHLAAYFDFTGEQHPLYESVNVQGTKRLLDQLQDFSVDRFIYSSTMLVQEAGVPGVKITEDTPIKPKWAYPQSKADAEEMIKQHRGHITYTILRLAGLYDDSSAVPTLSYQITRIYERDFKSHVYSGDLAAGQAFLHKEDMVALFNRVVERRKDLPSDNIILAGEEEVMSYRELQNRIGSLIFSKKEWGTMVLPEFIAKPGAWVEGQMEPVIPDSIDYGEKPFIKPFMIDLASDHYDLDIDRAQQQLDWSPTHNIYDGLEVLVENLKEDPVRWYNQNHITPPDWIHSAAEKNRNPDKLRLEYERWYNKLHYSTLWAPFFNMFLAFWLITSPHILNYESTAMTWSDMISGGVLLILSIVTLSPRWSLVRWLVGGVGLWLLFAPLIFWAPSAAAYTNGTIVGMIVIGLATCLPPIPGISYLAEKTGTNVPPGWNFSPSGWFQRMPIILLALVGFFISRYLCAYQLGHIDNVWEPFFAGAANDPQNGTEEIITSSVSEAWPVPDAGLGAMTYALEIMTGLMGSTARWRTMPWLVMLFGIMIVPLGVVSIFFIIIQPIMLGTWCTLCLIAAAAMLIQIPYSWDELVATTEFLYRRKKKGRALIRIFFTGDTDDGDKQDNENFRKSLLAKIKDMFSGGITLPWNLVACMAVGVWLMFTRLTLGNEGDMANVDHFVGAMVVTIAIMALAESGRITRYLIVPFGAVLFVTPFIYNVSLMPMVATLICGALLVALPWRKGSIDNHYGASEVIIK